MTLILLLKSISSKYSCFLFSFGYCLLTYLFHLSTHTLHVSLRQKWISHRQHVIETYFFNPFRHSVFSLENLIHLYLGWLLMGEDLLLQFCSLFTGCFVDPFSLFYIPLSFFVLDVLGISMLWLLYPVLLCDYYRFFPCGYHEACIS